MLVSPLWTQQSSKCDFNGALTISPSCAAVLQWLRRRGPPVSDACRNRLVRDKKVRILEDGHLRQIRASAALQQGSQLLIPKTAVAQWQEPRHPRTRGDSPHYHAPHAITCERTRTCSWSVCWESCLQGMPCKQSSCHADARTEMLEGAVVQHLRGNILHKDRDMLIINKPAGLPVQGGDGIRVSVDSVLPQLGAGAAERPRSSFNASSHRFSQESVLSWPAALPLP